MWQRPRRLRLDNRPHHRARPRRTEPQHREPAKHVQSMQRTQARPDIQARALALRPLEIDHPPDEVGGGETWVPPILHTGAEQLAKHRAERHRIPLEWRRRAWQNRWYAFIKPEIRARYRALQSVLRANLQNFIKKLR